MNIVSHLPTVSNKEAPDEIPARPDDSSFVHISLAGIEEEGNFAEVVNGLVKNTPASSSSPIISPNKNISYKFLEISLH